MESSFFYFFSASPQVLGGILALFGVFVIFKLQAMEAQMIGMAQNILDNILLYHLNVDRFIHLQIQRDIEKALRKKDVYELKEAVERIAGDHEGNRNEFLKHFQVMVTIKNDTIKWSTFTAFTIVLSLGLLPFATPILSKPCLYGCLVIVMMVCIILSFTYLIKILKKCIGFVKQ